jgi:hypothetical protein
MIKQTDPNVKTIRFPITADSKLQKMAEKCGLTKIDFFIAMLDYFYKSKKDPRDLNDELLKKELVKRSDNIISFFRVQERDLLLPIKKDGEQQIKLQIKTVDILNNKLLPFASKQEQFNLEETKVLDLMLRRLAAIEKMQTDRALLKKRFSEILEYYIRTREQLGMMAKQADKDKLVSHVRGELEFFK